VARDEAVEEVLRLERLRCEVLVGGDFDKLAELTADDLVYSHSGGYWDTKESWLDQVRSGKYVYTQVDTAEARARRYGDTVLLHGAGALDGSVDGAPGGHLPILFSVVWARKDDRWQFALWHATPLGDRATIAKQAR
jgi:hypothetical protein